MTRSGPANYDLYTRDGRYVKSFRVVWDIHSRALPLRVSASAGEIAIVYGDLIRAGHIANGDFIVDRNWHVNAHISCSLLTMPGLPL